MNGPTLSSHAIAWGSYPERRDLHDGAALRDLWRSWRGRLERRRAGPMPTRHAHAIAATQARLAHAEAPALQAGLTEARHLLRRDGLRQDACALALGVVASVMQRTLGKTPYPTQLQAAWLILQGRFAEMATGEGKTLAAGLAAAVGALSGAPVHVMTANDYLVQRDRELLQPLYDALGLSSQCVVASMPREARVAAYRSDVVYVTAKEVAFDYLKDHLTLRGERDPLLLRARELDGAPAQTPVLPGLCFAVVDEADSILLDEACTPLILSAPGTSIDEVGHRRAYELSGALQMPRDYWLEPQRRQAVLTDAGRQRVTQAVLGERGVLHPPRRAHELVEAALAARMLFRRDREYARTRDGIALIDEVTGRIAEGRRWTGALHTMIELHEGLAPSAPALTAAQITYQRFFPRYLQLGGMSGTLLESALELRWLYDGGVALVPLAHASRRRWLGERVFARASQQWAAVVARTREMAASGRPVLIGTDSVAASQLLSRHLQRAGIAHQVLNAVQSADEAARIVRAGQRGAVTVATNIAGRGTDIHLDADVRALGGLHVIACMRNRARRIDRQLIGRCARHGDPGSAERVLSLDDELLARRVPAWLRRLAAAAARHGVVPALWARPLFGFAQRAAERADRQHRRNLRLADRDAAERHAFAGQPE